MRPQATGSAKRGRLLGRVARDGRPLLEMARLGVPSRERGHAAAISLRSERACRRYGGDAIRCGAPGNGRDIARSRWDQSNSRRPATRSEEHTSELQSLMRISYAVFCLKKKKTPQRTT